MDTGGQTREMELRLQDVFDAVGVDGPDKKH
jgi:hypothetical protein